ncbi:PilZ domain-containing protein [Sphingomonas mollis]|uniref:PilZ domain-containing protein n=1 Tax=Sphingomonas mollis TaxID=2795726 RepID=A0ABS0XQ00_9SPHN|nr:PilZ domain-containing protein [Sphingomonas sp. BT553]MBJ6122116.1 PilZ domain-containing protein [Sphingomonas sp. BT553]
MTTFTAADDDYVPRPVSVAREPRLTTILLLGRMVTAGGDWVCRVRNLSSGGLMAECDAPLTVGEHVRIELRNLSVLQGAVTWTQPRRAGMMFSDPIDVPTLLHGGAQDPERRPRAPRLSATCPVLLWHLGQTTVPLLRDLSQSGCRLGITSPPPVGTQVRVTIPGLAARHATLRWSCDGEAGFAFTEMLSFDELSAWQADLSARFAAE